MIKKEAVAYQEFKSPISMHIELTSACNHKCIHCYNFWREPGEPLGTLSRSDVRRIIDNLVKSEVQSIILTGGEPLLFPGLALETIDLAQKAKIKCFLNTNLTLMTDEIAEELHKRDMPILTSFPSSDPKTFEKIVNSKGAFDKVIKGIQIATSHGIPVTANIVVMRHNKNHILKTGRFLHDCLGINSITATRVHPSQSCKDFTPLLLKAKEVKSIFDDLLTLRDELGITIGTLTCYPMCLFEDMNRYGVFLLQRSCSAGKAAGVIGSDGGVRPCTHADEVYGNAITESLLDIWPRLKKWRDGTYVPRACRDCAWAQRCGAGCRMDSKYFNRGRKDQPDPYMVKDRNFKIVMPDTKHELVDGNQKLMVNPHLRIRKEKFGTFVDCGGSPMLVTDDSAKLLQALSNEVFTLKKISKNKNLDIEETKYFFTALIKEGIIQKKFSKRRLKSSDT